MPGATRFGSEFLVNTTTQAFQGTPTIAALANGRFVVVWMDESRTGGDLSRAIRAQLFNADGTRLGTEMLVPTTTTGDQIEPTVAALADGRFIVGWSDGSPGQHLDFRAQIFNPDGTRSGSEFLAPTTLPNHQRCAAIAGFADGPRRSSTNPRSRLWPTGASPRRGPTVAPPEMIRPALQSGPRCSTPTG
jgi:hypothetical protein